MSVDKTSPSTGQENVVEAENETPEGPASCQPHPRGFIAEWTVTIILLLFGTTTLVQAFVIPTGSMEDTLLIGDHLLVDKLAYAPSGPVSRYVLAIQPRSSAATSSCSAIRWISRRPS